MKTSTIVRNGISEDLVGLVSRLVDLIPWPERRRAMGDVVLVLTGAVGRQTSCGRRCVWLRSIHCSSWYQ